MSAFKNEAAWIMAEKAKEMEVKEGPAPDPAADEVVIKVAYAAINPSDWRVSTIAALCAKLTSLRSKMIHS